MTTTAEAADTKRRGVAVLVGCNYANTPHELHGCINDVVAMRDTLLGPRFGFDPSEVQLLTDAPDSAVQPTGKNIMTALRRIVREARPGDALYFHYSGHGTLIPSSSLKPHHHHHPFRKDQAIVPSDFNLITDVDFRELVNGVPKGASFTILSDSCHSGGLIDKEKEQIGPATQTTADRGGRPFARPRRPQYHHISRSIPFESVLLHLSSISGLASSHIGDHLSHLFGEDASPGLSNKPREAASGSSSSPVPPGALGPDEGILLSGCQADETSADMAADADSDAGGKSYGAFSHAVQTVLQSHPGEALTNRDLVSLARQLLGEERFEQHPCLYCSDRNADAPFLITAPPTN